MFKRNGPDKSRTSSRGFSAFWGRKSTQTPPSSLMVKLVNLCHSCILVYINAHACYAGSTPNTRRNGSSRLLRSLSSFITKKRDHKIETIFLRGE